MFVHKTNWRYKTSSGGGLQFGPLAGGRGSFTIENKENLNMYKIKYLLGGVGMGINPGKIIKAIKKYIPIGGVSTEDMKSWGGIYAPHWMPRKIHKSVFTGSFLTVSGDFEVFLGMGGIILFFPRNGNVFSLFSQWAGDGRLTQYAIGAVGFIWGNQRGLGGGGSVNFAAVYGVDKTAALGVPDFPSILYPMPPIRETSIWDPIPPFPGTVRIGSHGAGVRQVQQKLLSRGWNITVDSSFGSNTDRVVRAFQREKHLIPDGIVGRQTWDALWTRPTTK